MIIPEKFHRQWLSHGSSPIDWCEDNYSVSPHIAEFTNTFSNAPMILFPIILTYHGAFSTYVKHVSPCPTVLVPWVMTVGLASTYFHSTLSLMGQFADEISLVWLFIAMFYFVFPSIYIPKRMTRDDFKVLLILYGLVLSLSWIANTAIFALLIWPMALPISLVMFGEAASCPDQGARKLCRASIAVCLAAVLFWFLDRFACGQVQSLGFPGLHSLFHMAISWGAHGAFIIFSFCYAREQVPDIRLTIKYVTILPYIYCSPAE